MTGGESKNSKLSKKSPKTEAYVPHMPVDFKMGANLDDRKKLQEYIQKVSGDIGEKIDPIALHQNKPL